MGGNWCSIDKDFRGCLLGASGRGLFTEGDTMKKMTYFFGAVLAQVFPRTVAAILNYEVICLRIKALCCR